MGTDAAEPEEAAVKYITSCRLPDQYPIYDVGFLSQVSSLPEKQGALTLVLLTGSHVARTLNLCAITVHPGHDGPQCVEHVVAAIHQDRLPKGNDEENVELPQLQVSHSGRVVILAGNNMIHFYTVKVREQQIA